MLFVVISLKKEKRSQGKKINKKDASNINFQKKTFFVHCMILKLLLLHILFTMQNSTVCVKPRSSYFLRLLLPRHSVIFFSRADIHSILRNNAFLFVVKIQKYIQYRVEFLKLLLLLCLFFLTKINTRYIYLFKVE